MVQGAKLGFVRPGCVSRACTNNIGCGSGV